MSWISDFFLFGLERNTMRTFVIAVSLIPAFLVPAHAQDGAIKISSISSEHSRAGETALICSSSGCLVVLQDREKWKACDESSQVSGCLDKLVQTAQEKLQTGYDIGYRLGWDLCLTFSKDGESTGVSCASAELLLNADPAYNVLSYPRRRIERYRPMRAPQ